MGYWPIVLNVLKNSDVIILIADARVPEMTRNKEIIKKAETLEKKVILVFNKIDLVDEKDLQEVKEKYKEAFYISGKDEKSVEELKKFLIDLSEESRKMSLRVGVVGYPNVGKSTLINMLIPDAKLKISKISGTTKKTHWIRLGRLRIMDSPGVIPAEDSAVAVGITSSKDPNKMKHPEKTAIKIIEFLNKKNKKILQNLYDTSGKNDYDLFLKIGQKKGLLLKGGEIDERRTAIKIIDDWQSGKISMKL
jgi:ribosome biogenesis GTPase A